MQNSCPIFLLISLQIHTFATGKPIEEVLTIAPPQESDLKSGGKHRLIRRKKNSD